LWFSWNPNKPSDPIDRLLRGENPPKDAIVVKANYSDNPWFPDVLRDEMIMDQQRDPDKYAHVWLGEYQSVSDAQVLKGKVSIDSFIPKEYWDGPYFGADWGFSTDPTTLVKCWIHDDYLYIEHEAYGVGVEIDHTPALFRTVPGAEDHVIRADSARPETISYMRRAGFNIRGAVKGKGSVEEGVMHLRSYRKIIIHPRCVHAIEESRLYRYKTDRLSGDILPELVDADQHCIDAIRYSLEPIIHRGLSGHSITTSTITPITAW
jgi:phage terminase large subunit